MNKKEANDFQKYFKIGSWIFTGIFVIFMFSNVVKSGDLEKIIKSKELGYNTLIKNNLSGGEKQKVILARSLYKDASMYIFDEAFSQININLIV